MRIPALILALALVPLIAGCTQQPAPKPAAVDTAADSDAIRGDVEKLVAAWNAADSAVTGPMIAEDAVLMQPDGPLLQGRDAILANMAKSYDVALAQQSVTVDEVIVTGEHAYARGTWNLNPTPAAGADVKALNGKWATLFRRGTDGRWQVWRWIWNQDAAPAPAAS
jgi:uncharacterized protein (TIGR02246 family)